LHQAFRRIIQEEKESIARFYSDTGRLV